MHSTALVTMHGPNKLFNSLVQQQVLYLSGRLDEVKGQLSEHASQETKNLEELERVKGELEKRGTFSKTMEAELLRKGKLLEQARVREDKLIHKLQHVRMYEYA